ncbi:vacuolar-type H+-ATPase subunit I [Tubulinosema ratisbonensis]|uniref:V-type proton ATPase subunit a n=1 Tax=Tubulinosema ratisbonensis TaxID=291195 RepID=A0A437AIG7_9MICR|nr:vacuolar-type H+-ATPase subunit I [Tubulinosema ratisbonensis]
MNEFLMKINQEIQLLKPIEVNNNRDYVTKEEFDLFIENVIKKCPHMLSRLYELFSLNGEESNLEERKFKFKEIIEEIKKSSGKNNNSNDNGGINPLDLGANLENLHNDFSEQSAQVGKPNNQTTPAGDDQTKKPQTDPSNLKTTVPNGISTVPSAQVPANPNASITKQNTNKTNTNNPPVNTNNTSTNESALPASGNEATEQNAVVVSSEPVNQVSEKSFSSKVCDLLISPVVYTKDKCYDLANYTKSFFSKKSTATPVPEEPTPQVNSNYVASVEIRDDCTCVNVVCPICSSKGEVILNCNHPNPGPIDNPTVDTNQKDQKNLPSGESEQVQNPPNKEEENISKSFLANEEEFIPPSFFHTGKFTQIYQELTNTFEVPKYGELNPGIFSVFFFPFFFGMMFSDTLHGLILLFLGIFLIYSKKVNNYFKESELLKIVENAKYLLISMGIYSIYFGLLFCDFGGVELKYNFTKISYFGVKHMADQKEFINKLKMKMSIILGAMHMLAGIILGFVNKSDNLISLISITVSYLCFVGYLVFLIFYKWVCEVNVSLINELVEMYTKPFDKKNLFSYQKEIQLILIITLILSMLVLFLNKPVRDVKNVDLWVEQSIHSIEYGVSLVSNTASYLRLWAVSLAHGTLTEILHANTFGRSFLVGIIALPLYLMMTFGLLIGLEGTSATLHALRLNWIEFSGKFMRGGGVEYKAFSFDEECD